MQWNSLSRPQTCLPGRNIRVWTHRGILVLLIVLFYNMGIDYSTYPSARTYNFGIKLTLK